MIGKLKGIVDTTTEDYAIIDVGGVGYVVFCSTKTLLALPSKGGEAELIIETHVREDHIHLYGFTSNLELEWFRNLTTVQGIGARIALSILSVLSPDQLITAIASQDKKAFTQISGIGPKLAERLLTELKSKAKSPIIDISSGKKIISLESSGFVTDAISALVNLGYNRSDVYNIVTKLAREQENAPVQELIRLSLRELAR